MFKIFIHIKKNPLLSNNKTVGSRIHIEKHKICLTPWRLKEEEQSITYSRLLPLPGRTAHKGRRQTIRVSPAYFFPATITFCGCYNYLSQRSNIYFLI